MRIETAPSCHEGVVWRGIRQVDRQLRQIQAQLGQVLAEGGPVTQYALAFKKGHFHELLTLSLEQRR